MDVTKLAPHSMPAYTTTYNLDAMRAVEGPLIAPNDLVNSVVLKRMAAFDDAAIKMPQLGTETLDTDGVAAVTAWISQPP